MAQNTFTFDDVCRMVDRHVPRNVMSDNAANICNLAYNRIWHQYDWRESLATLPPFYLIPNEQDMGAPFYTVPDDFAGLRKADLVYLAGDPPTRRQLTVIKDLNLTQARYFPHAINYNPDTQSFRVFTRVTGNVGAPLWQIEGTYKTLTTKLTPSTLTTTIPTKDDLIEMWIEGIKWAAFNYTGDPKAGQIQRQNGNTVVTGQLANFMESMERMASNESLNLGDPYIHPSEGLAPDVYSNGNGYAWGTGLGGY